MIHLTDSGYGPGTIIVAAASMPRFYEFSQSLDKVAAPVGTKFHLERSCDIAQNFNGGVRTMTGEWAWFLGDDHAFSEDMLMRLLRHDVDVVVPITPCKGVPFMPCLMHGPADGSYWTGQDELDLYHWDELSGVGLLPLPYGDFVGQAGMLVKKSVLDAIGDPWFKCGQINAGKLQEDLTFCRELQERGFTVHIDQEQVLDHFTLTGITAIKHQGAWNPSLKFGTNTMVLPDAKPKAMPLAYGNRKWAALPTEVQ